MFKNLLDGANSFLETVNGIVKSLNEIPGLLQSTIIGGGYALFQGIQQKGAGENVTGYWTKIANWYKEASQSGEQLVNVNSKVSSTMNSVNSALEKNASSSKQAGLSSEQMAQAMQQMGDYTIDVDNKVSNANKNLDDFSNKGSKVGNTLKETASKTSEFASGMTEVSKGAEAVNKSTSSTTSKMGGFKNVLSNLGSSALSAAKGFLTMAGNMALLSAGVFVAEQVASAIYKIANANKLAYQSAQDRISETESTVAGYRQQISSLSSISERYDELNKKTSKTKDEESELLSLRQQIAEISPDLVIGWDEENQPLLALNGSLKDYIDNLKEIQKIERTKKASQENTAGRLALNEIKKANETTHDRLQPGFDFSFTIYFC